MEPETDLIEETNPSKYSKKTERAIMAAICALSFVLCVAWLEVIHNLIHNLIK